MVKRILRLSDEVTIEVVSDSGIRKTYLINNKAENEITELDYADITEIIMFFKSSNSTI